MMSDYPHSNTSVMVDSDFCVPRLRLKPTAALPGYVDGGWWPQSLDPVVEFPALITELATRLARSAGWRTTRSPGALLQTGSGSTVR